VQRNFSLPSLQGQQGAKKKRNPTTKKQEVDAMIFNEVFIQQRADRLSELIEQHEQQ